MGIERRAPRAASDYILSFQDKVFGQEARDELAMAAGVAEALVSGALERWSYWPARREVQFTLPLINPKTGRPSRKHHFSGVLDGLDDDAVYEFKTT